MLENRVYVMFRSRGKERLWDPEWRRAWRNRISSSSVHIRWNLNAGGLESGPELCWFWVREMGIGVVVRGRYLGLRIVSGIKTGPGGLGSMDLRLMGSLAAEGLTGWVGVESMA